MMFMEDCIHLHACRRVQEVGRRQGHSFSRYCNCDCAAYLSRYTELPIDFAPATVGSLIDRVTAE